MKSCASSLAYPAYTKPHEKEQRKVFQAVMGADLTSQELKQAFQHKTGKGDSQGGKGQGWQGGQGGGRGQGGGKNKQGKGDWVLSPGTIAFWDMSENLVPA